MLLDRPLTVIAPTLDADVLAVLAQANSGFTTGQIRRVIDGFSEQGIRNVLRRLVDQGIVYHERVGNAGLYRFNREHLAAEPIVQMLKSRETLVNRLEGLCETWREPPVYAALYGSAARGRMGIDSDIDILLIQQGGASQLIWDTQVLDVKLSMRRWTGNEADIVLMTASKLAARSNEPFLRDLRMHALTIVGERSWFDRQFIRPNRVTHAHP